MFLRRSSGGKDSTRPGVALQEQLQHFELLEILEALACELTKTQHIPVFKNNLSSSSVRKSPKGSAAPRGTSSHNLSIGTRFSVSYVTFLSSVRCPKFLLYLSPNCRTSFHNLFL